MKRFVVLGCVLCFALSAFAGEGELGWWNIVESNYGLDLVKARDEALETVSKSSSSSDVLAATTWWEQHLDLVSRPEEILAADPIVSDPEISYVLARIEAKLKGGAPRGALREASVSGPYGVLDVLDLERGDVPADADLPPLPTPFTAYGTPFNLGLSRVDAWVGPPEEVAQGGVWLLSWTLEASEDQEGWLVLEAIGSADLKLDGGEAVRLRECGRIDPMTTWYRVNLASGIHRLRIAMSSPRRPGARLTLIGDDGQPLNLKVDIGVTDTELAESRLNRSSPRAYESVLAAADSDGATVRELLLGAYLAGHRGDAWAKRGLLERAARLDPQNPIPAVELAGFFLQSPTGNAPEADFRQAMNQLRRAGDLPISALVGHQLALRQRRAEDAEVIARQLIEEHDDDPRVLQLWAGEAIRKGWDREAEEMLQRARESSPGARFIFELSLRVLETLERWEERRALMLARAEREPTSLSLIEGLATDCSVDTAVELLENLSKTYSNPAFDVALLRLLVESGDFESASSQLEVSASRWGMMPTFDRSALILAAQDAEQLEERLASAMSRNSYDLELQTLAWRLGADRFYEPFRVETAPLLEAEQPESSADSVLLLDQAVEKVFRDGSSIYYYHGLTRTMTPEGARLASVMEWMPGAVPIRLRVIKGDGSIVVPNAGPDQNGVVQLTDLQAGDVIEEEYVSSVGPTLASDRGHMSPYIYRFADSERTFGRSEYALVVPDGVELKIEGLFDGLAFEERTVGSDRVLSWRADDVPPMNREPFAPPEQELLPWVTYGFGVRWEDVGDLLRDRMLGIVRSSPDLKRWGQTKLSGETVVDRLEGLIEAVVSEVEVGQRVLNLSQNAGANFSVRRGNRLAIVASVLLDAGWEVDLVLSRPFAFARTHLQVPNMDTFGVPLLRVRYESEEVWLDLEEQRRGVGHIRPELQRSDALALPLSDPKSSVEYIDELPSFANPELEDVVRIIADIAEGGEAEIRVEMPFRGVTAERMTERIRGLSVDEAEIAFRQIALGMYSGAENVRGSLSDTEYGALMTLEMSLQRACEVEGDRMVCRTLPVSRLLSPVLASLPERKFPLVLQLPILQTIEVDLTVPDGWFIERNERRIETEWGSVKETLNRRPDGLESILSFEVPAQIISPERYAEFSRFCRALDELVRRPPVIEKK